MPRYTVQEVLEEVATVDSGDEYPTSDDDSTESSESETDSEEQQDRVGRQGRKRARTEPDSSGERDIGRGATNGRGRRGQGRGRGQAARGRGTGRRRGSQPADGDLNPRAAPQTVSDPRLDDRNWQRVDGNSLPKPPHVFTGRSGFSDEVRFSNQPKPLEFLNLMVPDSVYRTCTEQTNKYAADYFAANPKASHPKDSRVHAWPDEGITEAEMRTFLALTIAMGILHHQDIQDYWSTDEVMQTPFFPSVMARNRFLLIFRFFHLNDNATYHPRDHPDYNPMHKLGDVYDTLVDRFKSTWYPGQQICVDEGMVPFRGNVHFRTYNPDKPDKYGLKAYQLCDSTNGYCCQFQLYGGKGNAPSAKGTTHDIVSKLVEPYLQKGHTLYCDNYYTSPQLFLDLSDAGMNACGTMRNHKGVPNEFKNAKLTTPQEKVCIANESLLAMKYRDRRDVKMLSSAHSARPVSTNKKRHTGELIYKPECIHLYNQYMGAVDTSDQMVAYLCFRRRTVKWWKKAFFHMFSLALVNAHLLHKEYMKAKEEKSLEHKDFRREVVKELISTSGYRKNGEGRRVSANASSLLRLTERHFLEKIPSAEGGKAKSRSCRVCCPAERKYRLDNGLPSKKRPGHESTYQCKQCEVALCVAPCMELYHTRDFYMKAWMRLEYGPNAVADD